MDPPQSPRSPTSPTSPTSLDLKRTETLMHRGFSMADPVAARRRPGASFVNAVLATALFRCWHILIFYSAWATLITVLNHNGYGIWIESTLLTVIGTVLGFIISYRTTSSFERYNEGRRLWSQIIYANRTFARTIWFHVPNPETTEERARMMIEKKTVINLLEAYAVAVKHYLRGEDGIFYTDLYYLVKFLPAYALPSGIASDPDLTGIQHSESTGAQQTRPRGSSSASATQGFRRPSNASSSRARVPHRGPGLPAPVTQPAAPKRTLTAVLENMGLGGEKYSDSEFKDKDSKKDVKHKSKKDKKDKKSDDEPERANVLKPSDEEYLFPASMPPKFYILDLFPFSLLVKCLTERGRSLKGKKAAKLRAKMINSTVSHNLPLELSLYLSSYISALQVRKAIDVPTINTMIAALNQLVDSLTGLERILTTPIPFSYSIHLWVVLIIYCLALPIQIWHYLTWVTIPATIIITFIFFGFLVAGEEIENPFGYDKNDLNLDHFTSNIIRNELRAITASPPPDPAHWAFVPQNDLLFTMNTNERVTPDEWLRRGFKQMQHALHN
ncbi:UPF0187-domain-containing protein [Schizophyllum commune Tattone D]|nr:UPF0187-domain-containing protein [Schizophyllum commune Tattone D]